MTAKQTQITTTKTTGIKASVMMLFMTLITSPAFAQI